MVPAHFISSGAAEQSRAEGNPGSPHLFPGSLAVRRASAAAGPCRPAGRKAERRQARADTGLRGGAGTSTRGERLLARRHLLSARGHGSRPAPSGYLPILPRRTPPLLRASGSRLPASPGLGWVGAWVARTLVFLATDMWGSRLWGTLVMRIGVRRP
jgi:hypothetical protein